MCIDPRIVEGHNKLDPQFDRRCAEILAERGVRQLENGTYQFTRDVREIAVSLDTLGPAILWKL